MPLDPLQHLTCHGPVFHRRDMDQFIGAEFPISVPSSFPVAEYPDISLNADASYAPCIPVSNTVVSRGTETQWASVQMAVPNACEALARVAKLRFSWDFMVQPAGWTATGFYAGQYQIKCSGSQVLDFSVGTEKNLITRRGFAVTDMSFLKGDMDTFSAKQIQAGDEIDTWLEVDVTSDARWATQPVFIVWFGHLIHIGMTGEGTAQMFTYFVVNFPDMLLPNGSVGYNANVGLGCIDFPPSSGTPDAFHDVAATLKLDFSPWHNYTNNLRETVPYDFDPSGFPPPIDVVTRPGSGIAPFFKLATTTDVANAYYGYESTYNTTTGALL